MPNYVNNMNLAIWDQPSDVFDYTQLAKNFTDIAAHDHSSGKGTQIDTAGIKTGAINDLQVNSSAAIAASKIAGTAITGATTAGGVLSGLYPNPGFANRAVDRVNIKQGIVPDIISGDSSGNGLPTTNLFDGYTVDYNFSKTVPAIKTGTVSTATSSTTTYTYNTSAAHNLRPGDKVTISGMSPSGFNITNQTVAAVVDSDTFTVTGQTSLSGASSSAAGTFLNPYDGYGTGTTTEYFSWRLRYNLSTSLWDCLGGTPISYTYSSNPQLNAITSATANKCLSVSLPFTGKYLISYTAHGRFTDTMAVPTGVTNSPTGQPSAINSVKVISYGYAATIFDSSTEISSPNARAYANMNQNLVDSSNVGLGSNYGTATSVYKSNFSTKNLNTYVWRTDGGTDLVLTSQSIVITPLGGLAA